MTNVRGYSDDLVYIESNSVETEIPCESNETVEIEFEDGTVIHVRYGRRFATWEINVIKRGTAKAALEMCASHDEAVYSDSFTIDSELKRVS